MVTSYMYIIILTWASSVSPCDEASSSRAASRANRTKKVNSGEKGRVLD